MAKFDGSRCVGGRTPLIEDGELRTSAAFQTFDQVAYGDRPSFILTMNPRFSLTHSERVTRDALKTLSNDWRLFHSVNWIGRSGKRAIDGEADFVLLNEKCGMIVLEVKGGRIAVRDGTWYSVARNSVEHRIKDPYRQVRDSKYRLREWIEGHLGFRPMIADGVVFPHITKFPELGPDADRQFTLLKQDIRPDVIEQRLIALARSKHANASLSPSHMSAIADRLKPTVEIRMSLAEHANKAETQLLRLTEEQKRTFRGLRGNRRVVTYGHAGTGKTVLAIERARQFRDDGESVLFVCYNELLFNRLRGNSSLEGVKVSNFHSLCFEVIQEANMEVPSNRDSAWWNVGCAEQLAEAVQRVNSRFGAIVVDEAQDFRLQWLRVLESLGLYGTDTPFYVFADNLQAFRGLDWQNWVRQWTCFRLSVICRNTREIASYVRAIANIDETEGKDASGPEPRWIEIAPDKEGFLQQVQREVEYFLREDLAADDLILLCENREAARMLWGSSPTSKLYHGYGKLGRTLTAAQLPFGGDDKLVICAETIQRFKGREAKAAIVILGRKQHSRDTDVAAYVGFSRARTILSVIASRSRINALKETSTPRTAPGASTS